MPEGSNAMLSDITAIMPTFVIDVAGTYTLQLVVNDGTEDSEIDTVQVNTLNTPPIANAGPDQTVFVGDSVQLDGSNSSDADLDMLTYLWNMTAKPLDSAANLDNASIVNPSFIVDAPGFYTISLVLNDGSEDSNVDIILVVTENSRPVADAGIDQTGFVGDTITLDGGNSSDVDNDHLIYT